MKIRSQVLILAFAATALVACGRGGSAPEAPVAAGPAVERSGPVRWNETAKAFELNGQPLKVAKLWTFDGSTDGFTAVKSKISPASPQGLAVTIDDPTIRSPKGLAVSGAQHPLVLVRLTRTGAGKLWDGALAYSTTTHGESSSYLGKPLSGADPAVNETTTLVYDMSKPAVGGSDWLDSEIDQIRIDLEDKAGGKFVIHQIAIAAKPEGAEFVPPAPGATAPPAAGPAPVTPAPAPKS